MADARYITTAISYPNGKPHIGHAYEAIAGDVIARFHKAMGREVRFQTGTDEHGLKMARKAAERGITPRALADEMSSCFRTMCDALDIGYDRFIRTVDPDHHRASRELWRRMEASGDIYLDRYEGWYSVRDEAFYDESELDSGEGGERLSPQGTPVEWTQEESWFFRLSRYGDRLLALYRDRPDFIAPERSRNEVIAFVEGGLRDLSISRNTLDWGVPVPGSDGHVMYVWVDALTNYLTGAGFPDEDGALFRTNWPADLHLIGKDIVRFHAVYWPAFLMSAGVELPRRIFAHGFVLNRGVKESKSQGNATDPLELADRYGVDALRYFLMREVPFGQDGTWSHEAIALRVNAELANGFGNLAQRSLSMIHKNLDGRLRERADDPDDAALIQTVTEICAREVRDRFEALEPTDGLERWAHAVSACNRYIDAQAPWVLKKSAPDRMAQVLMVLVRCLQALSIAVRPVIPQSADRLLTSIGVTTGERSFDDIRSETWYQSAVAANFRIARPEPLFPRIDVPEKESA